MSGPLDSAWTKFDRAQKHAKVLERYMQKTFAIESNCPRLGIKFNAQTGKHVLYVSAVPDLGDFYVLASVVFGDAIHNFRCALDHLMWQLALKTAHGNVANIKHPRRIQFPIIDVPPADFSKIDRLAEIDPIYHAKIEGFQPYKRIAEGITLSAAGGGGYFHSFGLLRDLDDTDKHRLLITMLAPPMGFKGPEALLLAMFAFQQNPQLTLVSTQIVLGAEILDATLPAGLAIADMEMAGYITPTVTLPEGWPVHHVIERIAALTIKAIREFEPLL